MTRRILGGLALAVLTAFGCQSAEERQAQELRSALRQIVDEIEELGEEEIALLQQRKEVVDSSPSSKDRFGYDPFATARVLAIRLLKSAEEGGPERVAKLREQIEEFTDPELPMLAMAVRGRKTAAERAVEEAKKGLAQAEREKEAAEAKAAAKERAAAERKRPAKKKVTPKPSKPTRPAVPAAPKKVVPPPTPPPPTKSPEEIRAEFSKRIDEVDGIHEKVISTLQAVQEAQTDQWQKRWARDAVTMATMTRKQDVGRLRQQLERAKDSGLGLVDRSLASLNRQAEGQLAQAQQKLAAAKPQGGTQ